MLLVPILIFMFLMSCLAIGVYMIKRIFDLIELRFVPSPVSANPVPDKPSIPIADQPFEMPDYAYDQSTSNYTEDRNISPDYPEEVPDQPPSEVINPHVIERNNLYDAKMRALAEEIELYKSTQAGVYDEDISLIIARQNTKPEEEFSS